MVIILMETTFVKVFTFILNDYSWCNAFFWTKKKKCVGCQYPCSTCFGPENGECLSCISPNIRNGTSCILENECTQNGFVDSNRDCQSLFSSLFSLKN